MKQSSTKLFAFFLLSAFVALVSALPYRHLITYDPADLALVPKETVVATQLHVAPNADRIGAYEYKEVPLISRKHAKEIASAEEEKLDGEKVKGNIQEVAVSNEKAVVEYANNRELINNIEDIEENKQSVTDSAVLKPLAVDSGNPIYITIPIYVNSSPGLPVTLSIGGQQLPYKANSIGLKGALKRELSPTSLYNKLP
ncbi:PREDICTED: uncharacterized protein LOC108970129 [Bactrocera latifrons]|uniref:uncharacterized protein LOC108970129 n=1 Tax=Bactrocera latifrons TaxID=174628 RepID=UPI0008DC7BA6|nr:PREDICTED: uncharacterized protein LOC108970129 [Bactrocera latifrons]